MYKKKNCILSNWFLPLKFSTDLILVGLLQGSRILILVEKFLQTKTIPNWNYRRKQGHLKTLFIIFINNLENFGNDLLPFIHIPVPNINFLVLHSVSFLGLKSLHDTCLVPCSGRKKKQWVETKLGGKLEQWINYEGGGRGCCPWLPPSRSVIGLCNQYTLLINTAN